MAILEKDEEQTGKKSLQRKFSRKERFFQEY